ncbi:MAG: zinc ABC transporter substrate-binding protein [Deltaproteobacteria bacterium]|nr:zinc ABC transporter substrate-binding protein [Deltaproteobacteria bacterium]
MKSKDIFAIVFLFLALFVFQVVQAGEPCQVTVSILPQKFFVNKIAGDLVKVSVMVAPGSNPATYEPRPTQMKALIHSKIYFAVGAPFEKAWLNKIIKVSPGIQVVHTDQNIRKRRMDSNYLDITAQVKKQETCEQDTGLDPHIWLSPPLVKIQGGIIKAALITIDPANKETYEHNFKIFQTEVDMLDSNIRKIFESRSAGAEFIVFHPCWGYFADAYGIKQVPIEVEGKEPSATKMAAFINYARSKKIRFILIQPQFPTKDAETIAKETGAQIVVADPLAEDWLKNLSEVAVKINRALN